MSHFGFVHASGFSIAVSEAEEREREWVHWLRAEIDPEAEACVDEHPDLADFLSKCTIGAMITAEDHEFSFRVEQIENLLRLAVLAGYVGDVALLYAWPQQFWRWRDAFDDECLETLAWLAALAQGRFRPRGIAFRLAGERAGGQELDEEEAAFDVAVCANLPRCGVVSWLTSTGTLLIDNGKIRGLRISGVHSVSLELRGTCFDKSRYPELVVHSSWPTVRLGPEVAEGTGNPTNWVCDIRLKDFSWQPGPR